MPQRTYVLALTTVAAAAIQCSSGGQPDVERVILHNPSGGLVYVAHADTAAAAQAAAVIPAAGSPANVVCLPSKGIVDLTMTPSHFWSGLVLSGTTSIYLTVLG